MCEFHVGLDPIDSNRTCPHWFKIFKKSNFCLPPNGSCTPAHQVTNSYSHTYTFSPSSVFEIIWESV